ncbi:MmpS family transport accessory protein [Mycobacteroides salmoniphilum]|uniref:Membrane protein mmpS4 n=1 Tax=Mycobacteroides salmoniphilum TaxID=404941 RepID=A0A4R8SAA6_9MYCO|nr:MmpS family transport accessory protein [Mycobacteroides salmoniphilum]TDZ90260.1 putative membrane protein mmpS4 [Mycobacteroides salmoniphilum]TEA00226.1 putative membrane protein mmpS4 [Mycobacteroides salmoniphilum]
MKAVKGFALLGRVWVPLIVVVSSIVGGFAVYRLHGIFGSDQATLIGGGRPERIVHISPKRVTYELFGPTKSSGMISYLDEHAQPQKASFNTLPWSHTINTTLPSVFANIVAQGDSDSLSCRIVVNGSVRDEQTSRKVSAQAFCLVKAA